MTRDQDSSIQILLDLANLRLDKEGALREFRQKHDLESELRRSTFGDSMDQRTLFLRDLAQRLWTDVADQGGIDSLQEFLFPHGMAEARIGIDWRHQGLEYEPRTKLQAAFYFLLRNNHLAKRCANPQCADPFFIASRVDERYCSERCKLAGRLATKRNWWKQNRSTTGRGRR